MSFLPGYLFALGPLLFVSIFDVWLEKFNTNQAYALNLISVGVVAFGCTGTGLGYSLALDVACVQHHLTYCMFYKSV